MDYTDGRITIFGLDFLDLDSHKMRQLLGHYQLLPSRPNDRLRLWFRFKNIIESLEREETERVRHWYENGGTLPARQLRPPTATEPETDLGTHTNEENMEEYVEEYDSEYDDDDDDEGDNLVRNTRYPVYDPNSWRYNLGRRLGTGEVVHENYNHNHNHNNNYNDNGNNNNNDYNNDYNDNNNYKSECIICVETRNFRSDFPQYSVTDSCKHDDTACFECLRQTIRVAVEKGNVDRICCPICPGVFSHDDIETYTSKEVFERYEYLLFQKSLPRTYVSCLAPNCDAGQIHESDDVMMICEECQFRTCVYHKLPWHEGKTCTEFDALDSQVERLEQEELTAQLLAAITQLCPRCGQGVTKINGCDHITCVCGMEFCYLCRASWDNVLRIGETAHMTTCRYHPNSANPLSNQILGTQNLMALVHDGQASDEVLRARDERKRRAREERRLLTISAVERRTEEALADREGRRAPLGRRRWRVHLNTPWEESQVSGSIRRASGR